MELDGRAPAPQPRADADAPYTRRGGVRSRLLPAPAVYHHPRFPRCVTLAPEWHIVKAVAAPAASPDAVPAPTASAEATTMAAMTTAAAETLPMTAETWTMLPSLPGVQTPPTDIDGGVDIIAPHSEENSPANTLLGCSQLRSRVHDVRPDVSRTCSSQVMVVVTSNIEVCIDVPPRL